MGQVIMLGRLWSAISSAAMFCKKLGYHLTSTSYSYTLKRVRSASPVSLTCGSSSCSYSTSYCSSYIALKCSNTECFSGEKLCPGSDGKCVDARLFCDGQPDCPGGTDEECYCEASKSLGNTCSRTKGDCKLDMSDCESCTADASHFECMNHQCISSSKRCDGVEDCDDGTDELKCVRIEDGRTVTIYDHGSGDRQQVCINSIGRDAAEILCREAGHGMLGDDPIQHGMTQIHGAIHVRYTSATSGAANSLISGLEYVSRNRTCYPLLLQCRMPECGTTMYMDDFLDSFIVHGDFSEPGQWPFQCLLMRSGSHQCGCSYIGGRWILTAAHCIEDYRSASYYTVRLGSVLLKSDGQNGQTISVARLEWDSYTGFLNGRDIALLYLSREPLIDNYTRPVCLGDMDGLKRHLAEGASAECYISGFGNTEDFVGGSDVDTNLRDARVGLVPNDQCSALYGVHTSSKLVADAVCVHNESPFQPSCNGDSGGPLVCRSPQGRWVQYGVTSYGLRGCDYFAPGVYCSVAHNIKWLEKTTGFKFN